MTNPKNKPTTVLKWNEPDYDRSFVPTLTIGDRIYPIEEVVRAVNSYQIMLNALQHIASHDGKPCGFCLQSGGDKSFVSIAKEAIAKAEGKGE